MASPDSRSSGSSVPRQAALAVAAALLTGVLGRLGTGLHPIGALTWLVPLPVLLAALRLRWPLALGAASVGWVGAQSGLWSYFVDQLDMPLGFVLAVLAFYPLLALAGTALFRTLCGRGRPVAASLAVPGIWASGEYLLSVVQPHGAWLSLAYTQAGFRPTLQIASATGVWGVTFLVTAVPATVAALAAPGAPRRRLVATAAVALLVAGGYAGYRMTLAPVGDRVRVAVLGGPIDGELRPDSAAGRALLADYLGRLTAAADHGAQVAVLPEKVFDTTAETWPLIADPLSALAVSRHVDIVVGAIARRGSTATNVAVALPTTGAAPVSYAKRHLIPGLETDEVQPGDGPLQRTPDNPRLGLIICKDLDFPGLVRDNRANGASVLLAPAWDMGDDGWLHARMAVTRGVESGMWIARAGRYGELTISDPTGRVVAEADATAHPDATIIADVATGTALTLNTRLGDWFAWLCAAAVLALTACATWPQASRRSRPPSTGGRLDGACEA